MLKWMIWGYHYFWKHPPSWDLTCDVNLLKHIPNEMVFLCVEESHCASIWPQFLMVNCRMTPKRHVWPKLRKSRNERWFQNPQIETPFLGDFSMSPKEVLHRKLLTFQVAFGRSCLWRPIGTGARFFLWLGDFWHEKKSDSESERFKDF